MEFQLSQYGEHTDFDTLEEAYDFMYENGIFYPLNEDETEFGGLLWIIVTTKSDAKKMMKHPLFNDKVMIVQINHTNELGEVFEYTYDYYHELWVRKDVDLDVRADMLGNIVDNNELEEYVNLIL